MLHVYGVVYTEKKALEIWDKYVSWYVWYGIIVAAEMAPRGILPLGMRLLRAFRR